MTSTAGGSSTATAELRRGRDTSFPTKLLPFLPFATRRPRPLLHDHPLRAALHAPTLIAVDRLGHRTLLADHLHVRLALGRSHHGERALRLLGRLDLAEALHLLDRARELRVGALVGGDGHLLEPPPHEADLRELRDDRAEEAAVLDP